MPASTAPKRKVHTGELLSKESDLVEGPVYTPAIDIHETETGLTLLADLPGVVPDTLQIEVTENVLQIAGRVRRYVPEEARPVYEEYVPGTFVRSFILSDEFDRDSITARLSDGVLHLELPKAKQNLPRRIEVTT